MKKYFIFLSLALVMASCQQTNSTAKTLAVSDPIMPMRMFSDTMHIVLTDYLPLMYADTTLWKGMQWSAGEQLACINLVGTLPVVREMDLVNTNRSIHSLRFQDSKGSFAIAVLPNKPVCQNLVTMGYEDGVLRIGFLNSVANPSLEAYVQNIAIEHNLWQQENDGTWTLRLADSEAIRTCSQGRAYLRIYAEDETHLYNDLLLPLQDGKIITDVAMLTRSDDHAQVLYSLMIDRFHNGNTANDWKMNSPEVLDIVDYQGGDIKGIQQKIEEGFFEDLGINTIWISPITQNPWDAWGLNKFANGNKYDSTKAYTKFSGYHGYWPIYTTEVEQRFTTEQELHAMLDTAHAHGLNVILDYVANHMHINSPTLQAHPDWHTDSILPDGRRNFELWDEARLTTWFDVHIPTLDLERPEVCSPMTDSALVWLEKFEFDGFRHDACKHIPLNYWRELTQKMKLRFPNRHIWMIGETYGNPELIGSYVKSGMLNAQFDFNIYHTAIDVLGKPNQSLATMNKTILESLAAYGSHHTMGNISGNHDKCRFISLAGGAVRWDENDKAAGWERHIGVTADGDKEKEAHAYRMAMLLEMINFTIPGVPCVYQGDEYGEAGANDPDNRHMMKFDGLNEAQTAFLNNVKQLAKLRRNNMALIYGEYIPVEVNDNTLHFQRIYMGDVIDVIISMEGESSIAINGEKVFTL